MANKRELCIQKKQYINVYVPAESPGNVSGSPKIVLGYVVSIYFCCIRLLRLTNEINLHKVTVNADTFSNE